MFSLRLHASYVTHRFSHDHWISMRVCVWERGGGEGEIADLVLWGHLSPFVGALYTFTHTHTHTQGVKSFQKDWQLQEMKHTSDYS